MPNVAPPLYKDFAYGSGTIEAKQFADVEMAVAVECI